MARLPMLLASHGDNVSTAEFKTGESFTLNIT
jgi:hypothetical protein